MRHTRLLHDNSGMSVLDVLVAMLVFTIAVLGLATASVAATKQLRASRNDVQMWSATQTQLDRLASIGYEAIASGTDTVQSYKMTWTVEGTNPKKITLVVGTDSYRYGSGESFHSDTFITYLAKP